MILSKAVLKESRPSLTLLISHSKKLTSVINYYKFASTSLERDCSFYGICSLHVAFIDKKTMNFFS